MFAILLYPLFFVVLLCSTKRKGKHLVYTMLLCYYLLSVFCASYLVLYSDKFTVHTMSITAVLFHIMAFYILLKPVYKIDGLRYYTLKKVPERTIVLFTWFIVLIEIVDFFSIIGTVSISSILENASALRQEKVGTDLGLINNSFVVENFKESRCIDECRKVDEAYYNRFHELPQFMAFLAKKQ